MLNDIIQNNFGPTEDWAQYIYIYFFFLGGGKQFFRGVQDPQKVINSFDHFVQENAHFFLDFTQNGGGQDNHFGAVAPLPTPGAAIDVYFYRQIRKQNVP